MAFVQNSGYKSCLHQRMECDSFEKVLITDDANFMRTSLRMMLERHGFEVVGKLKMVW